MILMCKNRKVYNIETEEVYWRGLLPGIMLKDPCDQTFKLWFRSRYSSETNAYSRSLKGTTFGQGKRNKINKITHALSLSDCYWIKSLDESVDFFDITPYRNNFWNGLGIYSGGAIPTLYVNGFLSKFWESPDTLVKQTNDVEFECLKLLNELCICNCCTVSRVDANHIAVGNFTNEHRMFEPADLSGKIDVDDFDENTIINLLSSTGIDMVVFDAVFGNGDRHAGNFGFMRNSDTGEYIGAAPIFDYDHALDSVQKGPDRLLKDAASAILLHHCESRVEVLAKSLLGIKCRGIFRVRMRILVELLGIEFDTAEFG